MEVRASGPTHLPLSPVTSSAATGTCAPGSTAVSCHLLAGGGGSATLLPSRRRLRSLMVRGRSPAPPSVPPPPPPAPVLLFLPHARRWGCVGPGGLAGQLGGGFRTCGERSASGRSSGLGRRGRLCSGSRLREGRCPAPTEPATVWFSDSSTDYKAGSEILCTGLEGYFLSGNGTAVHQRASSVLIFIYLMLTVSVLVLSLLVVAFPTQYILYNFGNHSVTIYHPFYF